ncbi:MAG: hybrid sensor histidine kinase/response regulator [Gemmatimonadales bacterium]
MSDTIPISPLGKAPCPASPGYHCLVLLVDDQPIIGETIRRMLVAEPDISFHYCRSAVDAVALATELRPTVILQDLVLADGDGLELVTAYRDSMPTATTPILVLSTTEDGVVKSEAFARGANDYMVKVPERAELLARIRYHTRAHLSAIQRDEAFRALHESQSLLVETNTALNDINQQLNRFVGMAAHDLRSPLGVLQGFADYMLNDVAEPPTAQQAEFLAIMQDSATFMLRLVDDLLDVSAIEAGKLTLDLAPVDIPALVEREVGLARLLGGKKEIAVELDVDPSLPLVCCDANRIKQVLTNLLTNAIKYSHTGTEVHVTVRSDGPDVIVAVQDHGQGIPESEVAKLFKPFGVTSVRSTGGEKSTGLGLMIAKQVVDAHKGRLYVESKVGEGSTFSMALPIDEH